MKTIELEVQDLMNSKKPQIKQTRRGGKRAPNDDLCTASEAASIVGVPSSTFQNYVRDNRVERVVPEGKKEGYYPRDQVLRLAEELRKNPPKRRQRSKQTASIKQALEPAIRNEAATAWIQHADELRAYDLDCELYGFENAVSPDITWPWWQKNPHACMILYNKEDRQDIWGLISIIPMEEEIIFKLLREEMNERDIRPEHVLTYETGRHYSCYVAAVSMKPQHRHSFTMLLRSVMQYWCKHPDIYIDKLFAFALGGEGSSGMHLIRKLYFWPRRDISLNAWELDLNVYNPSPAITEYQRSIEAARLGQKRKGLLSPKPLNTASLLDEQPIPVTMERATMTDIQAVMEISAAIYGSSGTPLERRAEWLEKNPEYLYVARQEDGDTIGYVSVMPLSTEKIRMILNDQIHPGDITADDLQAFMPGQSMDIYIASLAVRPGLDHAVAKQAGFELVQRMTELFVDLGRRGVLIGNVFARSRTKDGIRTLRRMGFTKLESPATSVYEQFIINIEQSGLSFIKRYKEALHETTR